MAVGIGQLDERVDIYTYTTSPNGYGEAVRTYTSLISCWAKVTVESGSESRQAEQELATRNVKFIVRYYPGINEKCRVTYDSENYDITNVTPIGRNNYLQLTATLKTNQS